jgi:receptor protein-tyrosine kinase
VRAQRIATSLAEHFTAWVAQLETPSGSKSSTVKVTTVQPAEIDPRPVSPSPIRNLALGGLLGLLLGSGLAVLRSRLDNTVKTSDDVHDVTDTGLIGRVLEDPRLNDQHVATALDEHSQTAEAFRVIRTNLQFLSVDNPPRVIVITSSVPGEGKSTLTVNLATALAQAGSRVMLVEADLRRPRITSYLGIVAGVGLTNVLAGTADVEDVAQPWGEGKLRVLASGPTPPNPSELLGSAQMRLLISTLRETQDYVVIDSPPLLPVTDAAVLSAVADGMVITTRFGKTKREQLAEAAITLSRIEAKLLGVVLNRVPPRAATSPGYGYAYHYVSDGTASASHRSSRRQSRRRRNGTQSETGGA